MSETGGTGLMMMSYPAPGDQVVRCVNYILLTLQNNPSSRDESLPPLQCT